MIIMHEACDKVCAGNFYVFVGPHWDPNLAYYDLILEVNKSTVTVLSLTVDKRDSVNLIEYKILTLSNVLSAYDSSSNWKKLYD